MDTLPRIFGTVIRRRREVAGLSQEAFAQKAGIHRTYISSIERGKVHISIVVAVQLATALETPLSRIWQEVERELAKQV